MQKNHNYLALLLSEMRDQFHFHHHVYFHIVLPKNSAIIYVKITPLKLLADIGINIWLNYEKWNSKYKKHVTGHQDSFLNLNGKIQHFIPI